MQIIAFGFLGVILIGSILLFLPISNQEPIAYLDALFVSVSAVCVTGLVTVVPAAPIIQFQALSYICNSKMSFHLALVLIKFGYHVRIHSLAIVLNQNMQLFSAFLHADIQSTRFLICKRIFDRILHKRL